jgi:hypothetical protein
MSRGRLAGMVASSVLLLASCAGVTATDINAAEVARFFDSFKLTSP